MIKLLIFYSKSSCGIFLLSNHNVPDTLLGPGNPTESKTDKVIDPCSLESSKGR